MKINHVFAVCFLCLTSVLSVAQPSWRYEGLDQDAFMKSWLVCGPVEVARDSVRAADQQTQLSVFENEVLGPAQIVESAQTGELKVNNQSYPWKAVDSATGIIDLVKTYGDKEYVYIYAQAEIVMPAEQKVLLGIGSDDAVKVWLNGKLVHKNWVGRPVSADDDLVPVTLQKGPNQLLLKVQNMQMGWGFACRMLGPNSLKERLIACTRLGNMDAVEMLLDFGVDVNAAVGPGLIAYHVAVMTGREEIADLLKSRGAHAGVPMPAKEKLADYIFRRFIQKDSPGASVLVARDGEILLQKGYGSAVVDKKRPVTPETTFRIGSVTKQFTAAAILNLQEDGKLSLDDPLTKYVPDFPRGENVTIHHLLTHTSGIHSYTNTLDFLDKVVNATTPGEMIETIKDLGYDFSPGEQWLYNNSGYYLLGYIIEKVSGLDYDTFLKQTFFKPLEMKETGVYTPDVKFRDEATGYAFENGAVEVAMDWDMSHAGGAGNLYSNVLDLYKWNEAVFNGRVLSDAALEAALTPARLNNGEVADAMGGARYGYGWGLSKWRGLRVISHGGGLNGFSTVLMRYPEVNTTVVVLSNCAPALPGFNVGNAARDIAQIYLWQDMEKQDSYKSVTNIDYAVYDDYAGQYDYKTAIMTVTREENHLYAQLAGQPRFEIFPRSENEFFWKVVDARVTFERDKNGVVTHAVHQQGGATLKAPRLEKRTQAVVDPALYHNYTGRYELESNLEISVFTEKDKIFLQVTGQPKVEMFPESETAFFLKAVNARIDFITDQSGRATALILHQNDMDMTAKRVDGSD